MSFLYRLSLKPQKTKLPLINTNNNNNMFNSYISLKNNHKFAHATLKKNETLELYIYYAPF